MNILHLSDIHFGRNYECYGIEDEFDNKEQILNDLIDCVRNLDFFRPEHIVVTGDIAWHGKKKEYAEAYEWFKRLLDAVDLTGKDITFCVGNHDVNRAYASTHMNYDDDSITEIDEIYDYVRVHEMEPPTYEYDRFCERLEVEPFAYPCDGEMEYSYSIGYKDVTFSSLNTVRLVAFNTALLSFMPKISEDKMWIGQRQVKALMHYGIIPNDEVHFTIALFHHAERFLHPNEICEYDGRVATLNLLRKNVDLILCGHTETGGKPVLQQQIGGGKILTAGATYYSDTHPNAFSILCIPDTKRDVCIKPFTYKNGWTNYELEKQQEVSDDIVNLPAMGDLNEECWFVLKTDDRIHEIPLKKVSVYRFEKAGIPYIKLDNRKEVLRHLDIVCQGPISGNKTDITVSLAPKMERNVRDMLDREEYFNFMAKNMTNDSKTEFYIESKLGEKIISGSGLKGTIDVDERGIELLKKIAIIEKYYDVILCRPDDLYERDLEQVELLNDLIENGYTDKLKLGSTNITDFEKLKKIYEQSKKLNSFCLPYEGNFYCEIFDVRFSLGKGLIVAGKYSINRCDLKYKVKTFRKGDSRKIAFSADDTFTPPFFVADREKAKDKANIEPKCEFFSVDKIGLSCGFIDEEK